MSGSFADADDLTQETFIQAFRRLERFRIHGLVFPPNPTNAPALANE
jgi:DNA-directed RNA polymerase specialized sigma24 family protein